MANRFKKMRNSVGYQKLLRGNKSMLGKVQQEALRKATILHEINDRTISFLAISSLILLVADAFVRDTYFDVGATAEGLEIVGSVAIIELLVLVICIIRYKSLLKSDPITSAGEDAERILFEVRDSHGRHATLSRIAGSDRAEFLCDFFEIKPLNILGKLFMIVLFIVLAASFTPRMLALNQRHRSQIDGYRAAEQALSEIWLATGVCNEMSSSGDSLNTHGYRYVDCRNDYDDGVEFSAKVEFNDKFEIDNFGYWIDINQDISEFPHLDDINDTIQVLADAIANSSLRVADSKLFLNDFTINQMIINQLAEKSYLADYRAHVECLSAIPGRQITYQYHYTYDASVTNFFYLETD